MTLSSFVTKSAFRNKRRTALTMVSIALSLALLTFMMTIWRAFYIDSGSEQSTQRLITRHRVSLTFSLPIYYAQKIKTVPGVKEVVPTQWFGGKYIDDKPEHFFAQFATDPQEIFKVYTDFKIPQDQLEAWQHDRAGVVVDNGLAKKFGWKIGDRIVLMGTIWAANLELTIRGIFNPPQPSQSVYFDRKYLEEAVPVDERPERHLRHSGRLHRATSPRLRPRSMTCSTTRRSRPRRKARRRSAWTSSASSAT